MVAPTYVNPSTVGDAGTKEDPRDGWSTETDVAKAVVDSVKRDFKLAQNYRRQYDHAWDRWRKYALGDQWANKLRPAWKAKPTMNYIGATVETIIPYMTDHDPEVKVVSKKREQMKSADHMQAAVREVFLQNEMKVQQVYVLKDAHYYGIGWSKQWYDPKIKRVVISPLDSRYVFTSPGALQPQQAEFICIALNRWWSSCVRDFPQLAKRGGKNQGVADDALTHRPVDTVKMYDQDSTYVLSNEGALVGTGDSSTSTKGDVDDKLVTQIERWSRDRHGQVWVTVTVGNLLVKHEKSPYKNGTPGYAGGSKYPFARCLCYPVNSQLIGMGEVAQLESPQDAINRGEAQIADLTRMCTSPYMRVHKSSRVSLKDITNRIASYIIWDGQIPPDWMPPPGVSGELFTWVNSQKQHMNELSGIYEAARGELPSPKTSGVAIENLQKATAGRIGLKTRMFESYLREVGVQVIDLIKQYYVNRTIRHGKTYIDVNVFDPKNPGKVINDISDAEYDVEIGVGSTLPVDKGLRAEQAAEAFNLGVIGKKEYLRKLGWDEEDIERALSERAAEEEEELKKQLAMAEAEAAAAPAEGAPAPQPGAAPAQAPAQGAAGLPSEQELAEIEAMETAEAAPLA